MNHSMTCADFYLICFAVGFCFSFFSFVFGGARTGRLHLPHFHGHVGSGHVGATHGAGPSAQSSVASGSAAAGAGGAPSHAHVHDANVSPFNFVTLTAFLAW